MGVVLASANFFEVVTKLGSYRAQIESVFSFVLIVEDNLLFGMLQHAFDFSLQLEKDQD